jgi:cytochrome c-type biogenesis protein CcmH
MRKKQTILFFLAAIFLAVLLTATNNGFAAAQDPEPKPTPSDNDVNRVARTMYCPVCENIPLDVCPTTACSEWRELIRIKLSEGWTDEQIRQYFAVQYGDRVLNEPPRRGLNWLVYLLPVAFFLAGAGLLWHILNPARRTKTSTPAGGGPVLTAPAEDDPYLKELEDELKKST